ncbi:UNVERIFIED_CONTAM: hypothetical protein RMT77_008047 [Armadillidium vulgare]
MMLKVAVVLIVSVLTVGVLDVQGAKLTEVVRKSVSVKSPPRDTSIINHFNPASHVYAAEGNVVINKQPPKPVEVPKAPEVKPQPKRISLAKKVSVHSPITSHSESRHFDPATHNYEATGEVRINRESSLLKQQNVFQANLSPIGNQISRDEKPSFFRLDKSVSVKSPQRQSSIISHFNPAVHNYEATGGVAISGKKISKRSASPEAFASHLGLSRSRYSYPEPTIKFTEGSSEPKSEIVNIEQISGYLPPRPEVTTPKTPKKTSSDVTLKKSVSVKSPDRKSNVVNHFNPVTHKYAATGGVVIDRHSSAEVGRQRVSVSKPASKTVRVKASPSPKPSVQYIAPQPQKSTLSVHKAVSVKSPQRTSSVISHFNPAGHVYAASGEVNIVQQSTRSPSLKVAKKTAPKTAKPVVSYVAPAAKPAPRKPKVSHVAPKRTSSDFTLQKTVSVKSPERKSSVISHFTPAIHKYAATGGVVIDRHSSAEVRSPRVSVSKPVAKTVKVKSSPPLKPVVQYVAPQPQKSTLSVHKAVSVKSPQRISSVISHFNPAGHVYAASGEVNIEQQSTRATSKKVAQNIAPKPAKPTVSYTAPATKPAPRKPEVSYVAPKRASSDFTLQKTVSVKSPERKSSVISHFTPATHKYAATGGVVIDRHSSAEIGSSRVSAPKPAAKATRVKSSPSPKPAVQYVAPQPQKSTLSVHKAVSVKSPQRTSSVISHFNPAGHVYAASGEVNIEQQSTRTFSQKVAKKTAPKPAKPVVSYVAPATIPAPRKPEVSNVAPKRVSSDFTLQKTVSVKSPERKSSVISHFTPASHKYAATGGVVIDRHSSAEVGSSRVSVPKPVTKTVKVKSSKPLKPVVQYVAPQPQKSQLPKKSKTEPSQPKPITSGYRYPEPKIKFSDGIIKPISLSTPSKEIREYLPPKPEIKKPEKPRKISTDLSLTKVVSVKSPERKSSVISHFTPAAHKYAATGGVVIDRHSSAEVGSPRVSVSKPVAKNVKVKSSPPPKPVVQYVAPQPQKSTLSVHKAVSVKSPQRTSSVISHFNPAGHVYAASGEVNIEQQFTRTSSQKVAKKTAPKTVKPVVSYVAPEAKPAPRKPKVSHAAPKRTSSDFTLQKTVSVKSPERKSSVISHFTPATHKYAATGGVVIDRHSSAEVGSPRVSVPKPSAKTVKVKSSPPPKPVVQYVAPQPQKSTLSVHKAVSVKSPQRTSSVISHFNPAGHIYAASGEVNIEQQSTRSFSQKVAKKTVPKPAKPVVSYVAPAANPAPRKPEVSYVAPKRVSSDFTLQKTVSVKSPERKSSVISHFTPATHKYAATGGVVIDRHSSAEVGSPRVSVSKPVAKTVKVKSSPPPKPVVQYVAPQPQKSSLSVHKAVSVKSPQRTSSVISHFNPAGHVYAASGEVNIEQQSTKTFSQKVAKKTAPKTVKPVVSYVAPEAKSAPRKPKVSHAAPKRTSSDFTLQKTVSVKSPERKSSVISHFTPATHKYAATGGVVIDRHSSAEVGSSKVFAPKPRTKTVKVKSSPPPKPVVQYVAPQPQKSSLSVHKAVSVKSPQRTSSVISHFNPAGHVYAASGEVNIEQQSTRTFSQKVAQKTAPKPAKPVVSYVAPAAKPAPRKPEVSYVAPKRASSDFTLQKTVSVKSPERKSSVISHFTPATHKYAATGGVVIDRHSSAEVGSPRVSVPKPVAKTVKVKSSPPPKPSVQYVAPQPQVSTLRVHKAVSVKSPKRVSSVIDHFNPAGHVYAASEEVDIVQPTRTPSQKIDKKIYVAPVAYSAPSKPEVLHVAPKKVSSDFTLQKTVSVKSPERKSSVISHFTPAVHKYAATGGVVISKHSSAEIGSFKASSLPKPATTKSFTNPRQSVKYVAPQPQKSELSVQKSVFVKSPQRASSVIRHFNPAGHVYAASGEVNIERTYQKISKPSLSPAISYKVPVTTKTTVTRKLQQKPVTEQEEADEERNPIKFTLPVQAFTIPVPKGVDLATDDHENDSSDSSEEEEEEEGGEEEEQEETEGAEDKKSEFLSKFSGIASYLPPLPVQQPKRNVNLQKSVSVKSPEDTSTVINHFNPAKHVYKATGDVTISRSL